ncbi:MAG: gamma-glutamylcyclotransferase [Verrucomicrobia bacterium]|nr:gamma-glutamylcyclotransferase [Verrucomicrobiota bacterium]
MSTENLVFVYGTLKRGCSNHHFLTGQKFLGEARTRPGFRLYALGGFPGMIPLSIDRDGVKGEVWSVDAAALVRLDGLEGLNEGMYRRERIVLLAPFADREVETYIYARSVAGRRDLGSEWIE